MKYSRVRKRRKFHCSGLAFQVSMYCQIKSVSFCRILQAIFRKHFLHIFFMRRRICCIYCVFREILNVFLCFFFFSRLNCHCASTFMTLICSLNGCFDAVWGNFEIDLRMLRTLWIDLDRNNDYCRIQGIYWIIEKANWYNFVIKRIY